MKNLRFELATAVLGIACGCNLHAADVTGTWKAEFDTQIGIQKYIYTLKQDGEKVTGKANSDIGGEKREVELKDGKLDGDGISFYETFEFDGNAIRIDYQGKVAGDEIKFTRNVGEFATEELVAKRVKDTGASGGFDAAKLVGTWIYSGGEKDGAKLDQEHFSGQSVAITAKEIKLTGPTGDFVFAYHLDTTKKPVAITLEMTAGIAVGSTSDGIIELDGDRLKLCYAATGGSAPTTFAAPAGSGVHYFLLQRKGGSETAK